MVVDLRILNHMDLDTTNQQTTPLPQNVPPETIVNSPISNQRGFVPVILGVVILLTVVAGGAYYLGTKSTRLSESQSTQITQNPTTAPVVNNTNDSTPTMAPTVNEFSNWKTYTNTAFKYTLKYPVDWQIGVKGNADPNTFPSPFFSSPCTYDRGDLCTQMNVQTTDMDALKKNDPDYYKTLQPFDPSFIINLTGQNPDKVANKTSLKVNGEDAVGFDYFQSNYGTGGRLLYVVVTNQKGIKYTITYEESQKNKTFKTSADWQDKATFNKILSSLTFTN
jgi:hypothetical protein